MRIDLAGLRFLPAAVWSTIAWKSGLVRKGSPWLGYRALKALESVLDPSSSVLEFGSGFSTLFLARRAGRLVSVESDGNWADAVQKALGDENLTNAQILRRTIESYTDLAEVPDRSVDVAIVDGLVRDRCVEVALDKLRPGGWMFLDNSDVPWPEFRAARARLVDSVTPQSMKIFVDLHPYQIQVGESILGQLPV